MKILPQEQWWTGVSPRGWQREALPIAVQAVTEGKRGVIQAIMGAGKSIFLAEVARVCEVERGERCVISTPTVALVDQLARTVEARLGARVGRFYTDGKDLGPRVVVACNASMVELAAAMSEAGLSCGLWIADEAHNSETATLHEAVASLAPVGRLGLTATPYRADTKQRLQLWEDLIYRYGPKEALRDGVVVPWEVRGWEGGPVPLDEACAQMIKEVVDFGPVVVDAGGWDEGEARPMVGTKDAEQFAEVLCGHGLRASFVHSYLSKREVSARIERLRVGELQVLVHVALLKEGVDMPWLRSLCLRRMVKSRVWFAQHVGRALRAHEGKTHAIILDPNDLFGLHSLTVEAALQGGGGEIEVLEKAVAKMREATAVQGSFRFHHRPAAAASKLEREIRRLTVAFDAAGLITRNVQLAGGGWRKKPISDRQREAIEDGAPKLKRRMGGVPNEAAQILRFAYANRDLLTRGGASDLLDLFGVLRRYGWPQTATQILGAGEVAA